MPHCLIKELNVDIKWLIATQTGSSFNRFLDMIRLNSMNEVSDIRDSYQVKYNDNSHHEHDLTFQDSKEKI